MSLSVKHLNGDSTFLLTFAPLDQPVLSTGHSHVPGTFTILVDPWISGPSQVWHPKFSISSHTVPSCIQHLSELPPPNMVLISQDKPDHCHEETLRQLDPALRHTVILATPAAVKKICSWRYFDPSRVHAMPTFSDKRPNSIIRFHIPSLTTGANPGEVTIAYIPAKFDMTGLHNAVGITYRPPATCPTFTPNPFASSFFSSSSSNSAFSLPLQGSPYVSEPPPTPPDSPESPMSEFSSNHSSFQSSIFPHSDMSSVSTDFSNPMSVAFNPNPKTLSVIYSPHGVTYSHVLPYATSHLVSRAALPLTLLLHAFDRVQNPWYLGGNISMGMPGGLEIARNLLAKCWISAHDEDKEKSGFSVAKLCISKYSVADVTKLVELERRGGKVGLDVRVLDCGQEALLKP
ncbi:hypothetical protein MMC14_007401 [Varicellaria rhodocarpa]|nr:hypothetical protein [Varicellaria rhodocarpa]